MVLMSIPSRLEERTEPSFFCKAVNRVTTCPVPSASAYRWCAHLRPVETFRVSGDIDAVWQIAVRGVRPSCLLLCGVRLTRYRQAASASLPDLHSEKGLVPGARFGRSSCHRAKSPPCPGSGQTASSPPRARLYRKDHLWSSWRPAYHWRQTHREANRRELRVGLARRYSASRCVRRCLGRPGEESAQCMITDEETGDQPSPSGGKAHLSHRTAP